jgi:hypothetical protein
MGTGRSRDEANKAAQWIRNENSGKKDASGASDRHKSHICEREAHMQQYFHFGAPLLAIEDMHR